MIDIWPVKSPDLSPADWRFALEECIATGDRERAARRLEERWSDDGAALGCLSVRSAFDLFLRAVDWAPGDEIVFSALTIPDMPRIARLHGLRPVALDLDPETTAPRVDLLGEVVGPRTRALVHAHLFGARVEVGPLIDVARRHGLVFVEDCAQCYRGPAWTGHQDADVTLFSFGPWKTGTALGGALARVRDPRTRETMEALAREDPVQSAGDYLTTVLAYGTLGVASHPGVYGAVVRTCAAVGVDHRRLVHRLTKGYRGPGFESRIRRRPAAALLAVMERRLDEGDRPVRRRVGPARALLDALGPDVRLPGAGGHDHAWWMMPVSVEEPDVTGVMASLLEAGFDTTRGRLDVVRRAPGDDPRAAPGARRLRDSSIFIPFDPRMPETDLRRLGSAVRTALRLGARAGTRLD